MKLLTASPAAAPGEEEARQLCQQREGEVAVLRAKSDQIKALRAKLQAVRAGPTHALPSKLAATFEYIDSGSNSLFTNRGHLCGGDLSRNYPEAIAKLSRNYPETIPNQKLNPNPTGPSRARPSRRVRGHGTTARPAK